LFKELETTIDNKHGTVGCIALDSYGNIAMEFNTSEMFRGCIKSNGEKMTAIFK
jgi:isoaspartyl peptidase/L-asparaginase-like protein (Ntn-hydrolase superfamily)